MSTFIPLSSSSRLVSTPVDSWSISFLMSSTPDRGPDSALGGQHGNHVEPGGELDVVDRQHHGRVRERQRQRVPDLPDGEHKVLLHDLLPDKPQDVGVDFHAAEVDHGNAVLPAEEIQQLVLAEEAEARQDGGETLPRPALVGHRLPGLVLGEQVLFDE
jgi:hypothetical protein